jgi:hypothetical protein
MTKLVPYLTEEAIEDDAGALLAEYAQARGVITASPIPIEDISAVKNDPPDLLSGLRLWLRRDNDFDGRKIAASRNARDGSFMCSATAWQISQLTSNIRPAWHGQAPHGRQIYPRGLARAFMVHNSAAISRRLAIASAV